MSGSVPTSLTPVAIVGVAALIPGARDASEFWKLVLTGQDMITDVPPGHWLTEDYYDPDPEAPDKTYGKRGAFLPPVEFDPLAFGVPPNTMPATDTTQLLSLMVAERVLADIAGADLSGIDRDRVSVILGTAPLDLLATMGNRLQRPVWLKALRESGMPESQAQEICDRIADHYVPWQEATFPGLLSNVVAGRIANRFDLHGTNCTTDAACASSLAALSSGMNELALGKADMVITGGVDTLNDILMYMCFSKTPALSRSGDCRPFSEGADGTVLGEGLIMFALRRLEDAERDGNKIYAVIRGLGSSSDGKSTAIYAPLPAGQERALRRAYESAGYSPDTVELVEAHGTGTTAGDLAEVTALRTVFGDTGRADQQWCALGSIKSQIGHTKSAAGAAGLLKAALALHHKVLPPTIKVDQPNPRLELDGSPFYLNTRARPWIASGEHPRRASVSSFGFGGSNFHVALEEYVPQTDTGNQPGKMLHAAPSELVLVSAESGPGLVTRIDALAGQETSLTALARGSWQDFDAQAPARAAIVATDHDDFVDKADRLARTVEAAPDRPFSSPIGIHYRTGPAGPGKVAFLFSGQGSQYVGMGRDLTVHFPEAQQAWSEASRLPLAERPLHTVVFPPSAFDDAERERQQTALNATEWAQPALAAQSLAQLRLLHRLGITPDCAGGHSFGELVALHSAGSLDAHSLVQLARRRGELMRDASERSGAMLAVTAARGDIETLLVEGTLPGSLWISAHNSPNQVVVSGETDAVEQLERRLADIGLPARRLRAATAFHSPLVEAAGSGLLETLEGTRIEAPRHDVYGNTDSTPYPADPDAIRLRLADHLTQPVNFVQEIEAMYAAGVRTFIEVGAGATVSGLVGQILDGRPHLAVSLDHERRDGVTSLNDALGRLALQGVAMDLQALWAHSTPGNPLPSKQFGLSMTLTGTNYGKSYPPHGGTAALPAPNPEQPDRPAAAPVAAAPVQPSVPGPRIEPVPAQVPQSPAAVEGPVPTPLRPDSASAGPWLRALEESDRQTAEAHAAYQRAMAESHSAFLALAESSLAGLAAVVQGNNGIPVLPVIAPAAAPQTAPAAAPQQEAAPPRTVPAPIVSQDTQPEQPVTAPTQPTASGVSSAATPATSAAAPEEDLRELLISVVAEKTGYPAEMLRPEMELETDLGIDSIKRVQILSALRERVPDLAEISVAEMSHLRSLGSIADALVTQNSTQTAVTTTPATSAAAPEEDLRELLISVVAEKTGYPAEMLRPEMELETDLGIDSIKRVQILSALRERVPDLAEISVAEMSHLRSLGSIADALVTQNSTQTAVTTTPATSAAAPEEDLRELLISVVAEKTGYPAEMLRPEMELETDLGIDSIKRVQILSALRERVPDLAEISVAEMSHLRSLGSIADALVTQNSTQTAVTTTPATSAAAPEEDLRELLISVVAEKTGYPAEMLRPEMELETDLGIDSIKRVQILSALRERVPDLAEISVAEMSHLRSLGSIADALVTQNGSGATPPVPSVSDTAAATARSLVRQVVKAVPALASGQRIGGLTSGSVAITDDGTGIAHQVANRFTELGVEAGVVTRIPADAHGVVFLGGLREVSSVDEALAVNREAFEAARDFARGPAARSGWFVTVQDTGGDFGMSGADHTRAWLGGLAGLARTARLEWPESAVKAIDCERGGRTAQAVADAVVDELLTGGPTNDVGLKADGTRLALQIEELPVQAQGPAAVSSESVIVATGGARGVTAEVLKALAREHRPRIALLGRTALGGDPGKLPDTSDTAELTRALMALKAKAGGPPPAPADLKAQVSAVLAEREIQATVDALHAAGAHVRYVAVDVRDTHALDAALGEVRRDWGPITGLIHGAGVLADRLLADKTDEDFTKVFDTKVGGLRALLAATESDPLTLLCVFSSVAARCGNPGQSDYAMANEVLNQVAGAYAATRPGCLVRSIGWGPWRGGMVTPALAQHFESNQVPLIPLEAGAAAFVAELADTRDVQVVINAVGADSDTGLGGPPPDLVGEIHVTGTTHPYLADHAVAVTPVLPLAMALEWFTAASRAENPGPRPYELQDVSVLRKVALDRLAHEGHRLQVRTTSDVGGRRIDLTDTDGTPHFRGRSLPAVNGLQPPAPESPLNLPPADGADLYDGRILFHGPRFRALSALHGVSDEGASATVIGARDLGWPGAGWHTDPAAVDGGLQLALLWAEQALGGASLPMAVGALRVYRPGLLDGPARCEVRARKVGGTEGECDIRIIDSDGVVRAEMSRVNVVLRPAVTTADLTATGE